MSTASGATTCKGRVIIKGDQVFLRVKFTPSSPEFDVPIVEFFEDYDSRGVEMNITPHNEGKPIWKDIVDGWDTELESEADPDYTFCSESGREKFLDMKVGLMVHFGLYSHLGCLESWAAHAKNAPSWFLDVYYTLWQVWNPVNFDADEWARLVKRSGLQFIQITSKHCEGFSLWDTKTRVRVPKRVGSKAGVGIYPLEATEPLIHYSVMDTPFKRDIIKELSTAFREHDLGFGIYYSHWDWEDPNFRWDEGNRCYDPAYNENDFPGDWKAFIDREREQLHELFTGYGQIDQVFFDCTWFGLAWPELKAMVKDLRRLQPDCMFSDRGLGPYGDFTSPERWIPNGAGVNDPRVKGRTWQVCDPIGTHWSYVPDEVYKDESTLIHDMIDIVAKGGTFVLAQGPMPDGRFPPEAIIVLESIGNWLSVNGEAIYHTRPWHVAWFEGEDIRFTASKDQRTVHAFTTRWPGDTFTSAILRPAHGSSVFMLGVDEPLPWVVEGGTCKISIPAHIDESKPCEHAWCFKIEPEP